MSNSLFVQHGHQEFLTLSHIPWSRNLVIGGAKIFWPPGAQEVNKKLLSPWCLGNLRLFLTWYSQLKGPIPFCKVLQGGWHHDTRHRGKEVRMLYMWREESELDPRVTRLKKRFLTQGHMEMRGLRLRARRRPGVPWSVTSMTWDSIYELSSWVPVRTHTSVGLPTPCSGGGTREAPSFLQINR